MAKSQYPKEFRDEVVAIALKGEQPLIQIAKDFGIGHSTLHKWLQAAEAKDKVGAVGTNADGVQMRELQKRNRLLEQENEVLRRATAYFSQAVLPK